VTLSDSIARLQACLSNRLEPEPIKRKWLAGVIGDSPSRYSKSPALWNAAFTDIGIDAIYLPFDVAEARLADLVQALKLAAELKGVNVTVPYKLKIIEYLDELDEKARLIKAVNMVVRTKGGTLIGYNTDGEGFRASLVVPQPRHHAAFVDSLRGMNVLMIGAGGAARAVAFELAEGLDGGKLVIANRTVGAAEALVGEINQLSNCALAIGEDKISEWAPKADLIINSTTKGQEGIRKVQGGVTSLEPYSALAPAHPAVLAESGYGEPQFHAAWRSASLADIEANNRASMELALSIPTATAFCDLIYAPEETVFLRHGRLTGHRTLNGKGMIINQAAAALFHRVFCDDLKGKGLHTEKTYKRIVEVMWGAWGGRVVA
jgi:shikimate dehydrogenase